MKFIHRATLLFSIPLLFTACSPESVQRLQHDHNEEDVRVYRGMEYVYSDAESSSAILAYYRHIEGRIVLDLEVINYGDEPIRFSTDDISYSAYQFRFRYDENPDDGEWYEFLIAEGEAHNPEEMILNIDRETSRATARNRTNVVLESIAGTANAIDDISSIGSSSSSERAARDVRRTRLAKERAERREQFYAQAANLNDMRAYWETSAIRTTDLLPGETLAGEISITNIKEARIYLLDVQIGNDLHRFRFFQRSYEP
ncbi:MAG: hypothetical protein EA391_07970 [Balneolaceae bacterium]|nr:MAG: hypothetical protein EA391_07970 [Balneolaceae bacterium]